MADSYIVGDTLRLDLKFETRDNAGLLVNTNPTTVTITMVQPGIANVVYTLASVEITTNGTGKYILKHPLTVGGNVQWRISSTGAAAAAAQGVVIVEPKIL
jgi:hypothetical protein